MEAVWDFLQKRSWKHSISMPTDAETSLARRIYHRQILKTGLFIGTISEWFWTDLELQWI
jgi:hypothetical protein